MTDPPPASRRRLPRWIRFVPALAVAAVGAVFGYGIAYFQSLGGMSAMGAAFVGILLVALIGLAIVVGIVAAVLPHGRGQVVMRQAFMVAGLLVAGAVVGYVPLPLLGAGYQEPVTLTAHGNLTVTLDGEVGFATNDGSTASCGSALDGEEVVSISGLELGELRGGTLRGGFNGDEGPMTVGSTVQVSLFIDGADVEPGAQPFWVGVGRQEELDADGRGGLVTFAGLRRHDDGKSEPSPGSSTIWPAELAGQMRWDCDGWDRG